MRPQRLLKLATLLESGQAWSGKELAKQFQVCKRTIFRDIQLLRNIKVPVVFDSIRGGFRVSRETPCNCSKIQADELVALVLAIKYVGPLPESLAVPCDRAIAKILSGAPAHVRQQAIQTLERYALEADDSSLREIFEQRRFG